MPRRRLLRAYIGLAAVQIVGFLLLPPPSPPAVPGGWPLPVPSPASWREYEEYVPLADRLVLLVTCVVSAEAAGIHLGRLPPPPLLLPLLLPVEDVREVEDVRDVERDDRVGAWLRCGLMVAPRATAES